MQPHLSVCIIYVRGRTILAYAKNVRWGLGGTKNSVYLTQHGAADLYVQDDVWIMYTMKLEMIVGKF